MFHIYLARALTSRLSGVGRIDDNLAKEQLGCSMYSQMQPGIWPNGFQVVLCAWKFQTVKTTGGSSKWIYINGREGIGVATRGSAWRSWSFSDLYGVVSQLNPS